MLCVSDYGGVPSYVPRAEGLAGLGKHGPERGLHGGLGDRGPAHGLEHGIPVPIRHQPPCRGIIFTIAMSVRV